MKLNNKNLLNADSCAFFYSPEVWQPEGGPYSPKAIENQIKLIADSGIDTYIINPNTQMPWYPSNIGIMFLKDIKGGTGNSSAATGSAREPIRTKWTPF